MSEPLSTLRDRFRSYQTGNIANIQMSNVRNYLLEAAEKIDAELPPGAGRERALVMTKLEEAMFWANAGIARWDGQ